MKKDGTPIGGKWSFDEDNEKNFPVAHLFLSNHLSNLLVTLKI